MKVVELKNVIKDYPLGKTLVHALRGINLVIDKGDFVSIVGPSGSGKTTLLNIIGCIDQATAGEVRINGIDVGTVSDKEQTSLRLHTIGFIFQTFNLVPVLTARENVEFPLLLMRNKRFTRHEIRQKAATLLEAVGLAEHIEHRPYELSGGQRQRVAIARALVTGPAIVLADEPTANLDSETGAKILTLMQELNKQEQTTFIFSTHDPDILKYAHSIIRIHDGRLSTGQQGASHVNS